MGSTGAARGDVAPVFEPYRALGHITGPVPFSVHRRGRDAFVTCAIGRTWQLYSADRLRLKLVGPQLDVPEDLSAVAASPKGDLTFAAAGGALCVCFRAHVVQVEPRAHIGRILAIECVGDDVFTLGEDGTLAHWSPEEGSDAVASGDAPHLALEGRVTFEAGFEPTCMAHPPTYINKFVVGARDGRAQLWNVVTGRLVYEFPGWSAPVACIRPSPAIDVVAFGLGNGDVVLHNLRFDETIASYGVGPPPPPNGVASPDAKRTRADSGAAASDPPGSSRDGVTCVGFSNGTARPLLAAGTRSGLVVVWDLDKRTVHHVLDAHRGRALLALHFFPGKPVLMTSGEDNALRQWLFDGPEMAPRLLRFRDGHAAPPGLVRFYGEGGKRLLSAGSASEKLADRSLRLFSVVQDSQSREMSQRNVRQRAKRMRVDEDELKLAPIAAMAACPLREHDW